MQRVIIATILLLVDYASGHVTPTVDEYNIRSGEAVYVTLHGEKDKTCSLMELCENSASINMYSFNSRHGHSLIFNGNIFGPYHAENRTCGLHGFSTVCQFQYGEDKSAYYRQPRNRRVTNDQGLWVSSESNVTLLMNMTVPEPDLFASLRVITAPATDEVDPCSVYRGRSYCGEPKFSYLTLEMFVYKKYGQIIDDVDMFYSDVPRLILKEVAEITGVLYNSVFIEQFSFKTWGNNHLYTFVFKIAPTKGVYSRLYKLANGNRVFQLDNTTEMVVKNVINMAYMHRPLDIVPFRSVGILLMCLVLGTSVTLILCSRRNQKKPVWTGMK